MLAKFKIQTVKMQCTLDRWHQNKIFELTIISVIIISSLMIGIKTYDISKEYLFLLAAMDTTVTMFFLAEIMLRFFACPQKKRFFSNPWNVFDTLIVSVSLIPIDNIEHVLLARLARIFRVLRLVSAVPELRVLVNALMKAMPAMGYVLLLMFILFYMYAAFGSFIFSSINHVLWGDISISMLTLFRVITFEDWTDVMYETMTVYPWSWAYYLSFIFFNAFVFLNMMIGIVIEKMQKERIDQEGCEEEVVNRLARIEKRLNELQPPVENFSPQKWHNL